MTLLTRHKDEHATVRVLLNINHTRLFNKKNKTGILKDVISRGNDLFYVSSLMAEEGNGTKSLSKLMNRSNENQMRKRNGLMTIRRLRDTRASKM